MSQLFTDFLQNSDTNILFFVISQNIFAHLRFKNRSGSNLFDIISVPAVPTLQRIVTHIVSMKHEPVAMLYLYMYLSFYVTIP